MKTRMAFANRILLLVLLTSALSASSESLLTNGLVAYYPFNGNANDASGNGNDGTVYGATLAPDRFGHPDSAYAFDGTSSVIIVPDSPSLRITNDITVTCWLNFAAANNPVRFVGKGASCRNYGLYWDGPGTGWLFQQFPAACNGCQDNTASSSPPADVGGWHQLIGVRSGNVSDLYLDGVLLQEHSPVCSTNSDTGGEALIIGAPDPTNDMNFVLMKGSLDDIRIFNRALSASEIQQLYDIESGARVALLRAVKLSFSHLTLGTNYQLQVSSNLSSWTDQGSRFVATNSSMVYPQYFDVGDFGQLFFRLQVAP